MTDTTGPVRADLRQALLDLVDELVPELMRPSALFDEGTEEIVAKHGKDYPITALVENDKTTQAYNMIPDLIADSVMRMRSVVANHLAPSGAQMAYADARVLARSLEFDGPMHLVKADRFLYPQYDGKLGEWASSSEVKAWLADQAQKNLLDSGRPMTSDVRHRYEQLAMSSLDPEGLL